MSANRSVAALLFWLVPLSGALSASAFAHYILGAYDPLYGQLGSFCLAVALCVALSGVGAAVFAGLLGILRPVSSETAGRFYVVSALLGIATFIASLGLATLGWNELDLDVEVVFLFAPGFVTLTLSASVLGVLKRSGWLEGLCRTGCIKCGYDLRGNRSGRCPECGDAQR